MNFAQWWNSSFGSRQPSRPSRAGTEPNTLRIEQGNQSLNRPVVFDPALSPLNAWRAGEPRFESAQDRDRWQSIRTSVMHFIVSQVMQSEWADRLMLRGSIVMATWFPDQARRPGDLDWVVIPDTIIPDGQLATTMIQGIVKLICGRAILEGVEIPSNGYAMEEIWTYEKAPGIRVVFTWSHSDSRFDGTVQLDFVFGEKLPTLPVMTDLVIGSFPSLRVRTASPQQSLAWKLLWLATDQYPMGKDLYDAVLLAKSWPLPARLLRDTFLLDREYGAMLLYNLPTKFLTDSSARIEWDEFLKEYPEVTGSAADWIEQLKSELKEVFEELDSTR